MELSKMGFVAKEKQGANKLNRMLRNIDAHYSNERSTGNDGDKYEKGCSQLVSAHGIKSEFVAKQGRADLIVYLPDPETDKLRRYVIEIKTGSGIVAMLEPECSQRSIKDFTEDDVLKGVDLVIYHPEPKNLTSVDELMDTSCVMTREAFIQMVCEAGGTRKAGFTTCFTVQVNNTALVKKNRELPGREYYNKKTGKVEITKRGCPRWTDCICLQSQYLESRAYMIRTGIKAGRIENLRKWLERNGRA